MISEGVLEKPTRKTFTHSEATKLKFSKNAKQLHPNGPFFGKTHTEETKQKIKQSNTNFVHTEETKAYLSEIRKGENNPMFGSIGTMAGRTGSSHPAFGSKWYVNTITGEIKKFRPEEINTLCITWKPGRKL